LLFERTALSKRPDKLARLEIRKLRDQNELSADLVCFRTIARAALTRLDGFDAPENFFYCASGWYGAGTLIA
jgi:hypothetical protein